jgi:hypothetical protein
MWFLMEIEEDLEGLQAFLPSHEYGVVSSFPAISDHSQPVAYQTFPFFLPEPVVTTAAMWFPTGWQELSDHQIPEVLSRFEGWTLSKLELLLCLQLSCHLRLVIAIDSWPGLASVLAL